MVLGLIHIHGRGYVHCNIKPTNVLLAVLHNINVNDDFIAKIADFGLAKRVTTHRRKGQGE